MSEDIPHTCLNCKKCKRLQGKIDRVHCTDTYKKYDGLTLQINGAYRTYRRDCMPIDIARIIGSGCTRWVFKWTK